MNNVEILERVCAISAAVYLMYYSIYQIEDADNYPWKRLPMKKIILTDTDYSAIKGKIPVQPESSAHLILNSRLFIFAMGMTVMALIAIAEMLWKS